jgi:hypothetical protein
MTEEISFCGYRCDLCAARSDDPEVRQRMVDGWRKYLGHQHYTVENVRCDGCRTEGRLADQQCQARPCALSRGVESCAFCEDFLCEKVTSLLSERLGMLIFLHKKMQDITEEEYNLCIRQFESMPNMVRMLLKARKLPVWVEKVVGKQPHVDHES